MKFTRRSLLTSLIAAPVAAALPKSTSKPLVTVTLDIETERGDMVFGPSILEPMNWAPRENQSQLHTIAGPCGIGRTQISMLVAEEYMRRGDNVLFIHDGYENGSIVRFWNSLPQAYRQRLTVLKTHPNLMPWPVDGSFNKYGAVVWDMGIYFADWQTRESTVRDFQSKLLQTPCCNGFMFIQTHRYPVHSIEDMPHTFSYVARATTTTLLSRVVIYKGSKSEGLEFERSEIELNQVKSRFTPPHVKRGRWILLDPPLYPNRLEIFNPWKKFNGSAS